LESLAASHSDCTLVLDEFGQLDPREAGEAAYLLSNGVGKQRAGRTGAARPRLSWRLMTLSAGEVDLAELMAEAGRRMRAGQELRLVTVPADAGAHLGVFETLHGFDGPGELAQHLTRATEQAFGTAGRAWLEHLAANFEEVSSDLREHIDAIGREFVPEAASGQVARVGRRFALIAAAGELATAAGLTGWPAGEATHAARRCFNAWIESRPGGIGMSEDAMMLRQIRGWFALHGEARFTPWDRADDDRRPQTMNRAGWRRAIQTTSGVVETTGWEWFVLPDVFRKDVCIGFSERAALRLLKKLGHLHTESKGLTCRASPPGAHHVQVVRVRPSLLEGDDE
jgi:putative DNA primase/helicase